MTHPCRLLVDLPASGVWNMAADDVLLAAAEGAGTPALRLYRWAPATLSLGYFQKLSDRAQHAASQACPVVRRASGGGAIVHDAELTYSFAAPKPLAGKPSELYAAFHETLADAMAELGSQAERYGARAGEATRSPQAEPFLCFARRSAEDLVADLAKVAGSAQRRLRGALLQHGSVLLAASAAAPELPGLEQLGETSPIGFQQLADAWLPRLGKRLGLAWQPSTWTLAERNEIARCAAAKYATWEWTSRK